MLGLYKENGKENGSDCFGFRLQASRGSSPILEPIPSFTQLFVRELLLEAFILTLCRLIVTLK